MWMASPPEVHSALLGNGPGVSPLLAAARAWESLSAEYSSVTAKLAEALDAVRVGAWQGPTAECYAAAHAPFLAWLQLAGEDSAHAAGRHEILAAAYTAAVAGMPTLAELATNHAAHAVLVATNFFGVNTAAIAANEADYERMWIQAATTMQTYQATADTTLAPTPSVAPRPDGRPRPQVINHDNGDDSRSRREFKPTDILHALFDGPFDEIAEALSASLPTLSAISAGGAGGEAAPVAAGPVETTAEAGGDRKSVV